MRSPATMLVLQDASSHSPSVSLTARSKFLAACVGRRACESTGRNPASAMSFFFYPLLAALSVRLWQVGLRLHDLGPRPAVGEFDQFGVVAARAGRVARGSRGSRRPRIAAQPVLRRAQR